MPSAPDAEPWMIEDPGCQQMVGYKTCLDKETGVCTVTLDLEAKHMNRHGILHGGMVATVLDVVCGNTASHFFDPENHAALVTVSLNINYVGAGRGGRVTATAQPVGGGRSISYVNGELRDEEGRLLATASGIFKRIRK